MPIFGLTDQTSLQPVSASIPPEGSPVSDVVSNPEQVEKSSTMKVIRKLGSSYTPSIKDALSGNSQENKVNEDAIKSNYSQYDEALREPVTHELLVEKWNEFKEKMADRPSLCSALLNVPELTDGNKLVLKIGNSVQEEDIRLIKPELISWLRKVLRNSGIELTTKFEKIESERMIYSDSEKLQIMMKKNPVLNELKQKFNLDFHD